METRESLREVENLRFRFQMNNRLRLECLAAVSRVFREFGEPITDELLAGFVFALPQELITSNGDAYERVEQVAGTPPESPQPGGLPPQGPKPGLPPQGPKPGLPPEGPKPGLPPEGPKPGLPPEGPKPGLPPEQPLARRPDVSAKEHFV